MISQSCLYHSFYFIMSNVSLVIKVLWYKSHYRVNEDWKAARIALGCHHLLGGCNFCYSLEQKLGAGGLGRGHLYTYWKLSQLAGHKLSWVLHILQSLFLKLFFHLHLVWFFSFGVAVLYTMFGFALNRFTVETWRPYLSKMNFPVIRDSHMHFGLSVFLPCSQQCTLERWRRPGWVQLAHRSPDSSVVWRDKGPWRQERYAQDFPLWENTLESLKLPPIA